MNVRTLKANVNIIVIIDFTHKRFFINKNFTFLMTENDNPDLVVIGVIAERK